MIIQFNDGQTGGYICVPPTTHTAETLFHFPPTPARAALPPGGLGPFGHCWRKPELPCPSSAHKPDQRYYYQPTGHAHARAKGSYFEPSPFLFHLISLVSVWHACPKTTYVWKPPSFSLSLSLSISPPSIDTGSTPIYASLLGTYLSPFRNFLVPKVRCLRGEQQISSHQWTMSGVTAFRSAQR